MLMGGGACGAKLPKLLLLLPLPLPEEVETTGTGRALGFKICESCGMFPPFRGESKGLACESSVALLFGVSV